MKRIKTHEELIKIADKRETIGTMMILSLLPISFFSQIMFTGIDRNSTESQNDGQNYEVTWKDKVKNESERKYQSTPIQSLGDTTNRIDQDILMKEKTINGQKIEKPYLVLTKENKDGSKKIISEKEMIIEKSD